MRERDIGHGFGNLNFMNMDVIGADRFKDVKRFLLFRVIAHTDKEKNSSAQQIEFQFSHFLGGQIMCERRSKSSSDRSASERCKRGSGHCATGSNDRSRRTKRAEIEKYAKGAGGAFREFFAQDKGLPGNVGIVGNLAGIMAPVCAELCFGPPLDRYQRGQCLPPSTGRQRR